MNGDLLNVAWQRQLQARVAEFHDALREVAAKEHSSSRIHQLRVAVRRLEAALFLCEPGLRRTQRRWFQRCCARLRETSNEMRDYDIVLKWCEQLPDTDSLKSEIHNRKSQAAKQLLPLVKRLVQGDKIPRHSRRLIQPQSVDFADCLATRLLELNRRCMERAGRAVNEEQARHRWRISCKSLRYALEFMTVIGCEVDLERPLADLKLLQEELGAASDKATIKCFMAELHSDLAGRLNEERVDIALAIERFASGVAGSLAAVNWCLRTDVEQYSEPAVSKGGCSEN